MSSLRLIKHLRPYTLDDTGATTDPYVEKLVKELLPSALPSLSSYSRGMYTLDRHLQALQKYNIDLIDLAQYRSALQTSNLSESL